MAAKAPASGPKSSRAIRLPAMGVLAAPAKTAAKPMAASRDDGGGRMLERALPRVAAMKKRGGTSPPLKPAPRVRLGKGKLGAESERGGWWEKAGRRVGEPRARGF